MRIFGVSLWTILIIFGAMWLQSKYNLIQKLPVVGSSL
jgi:hypothetical protein